jgi:hypothetical protein
LSKIKSYVYAVADGGFSSLVILNPKKMENVRKYVRGRIWFLFRFGFIPPFETAKFMSKEI